jgi:hypothetical protein
MSRSSRLVCLNYEWRACWRGFAKLWQPGLQVPHSPVPFRNKSGGITKGPNQPNVAKLQIGAYMSRTVEMDPATQPIQQHSKRKAPVRTLLCLYSFRTAFSWGKVIVPIQRTRTIRTVPRARLPCKVAWTELAAITFWSSKIQV